MQTVLNSLKASIKIFFKRCNFQLLSQKEENIPFAEIKHVKLIKFSGGDGAKQSGEMWKAETGRRLMF